MKRPIELLTQARAELVAELAQVDAAILALNGGKRRGRPPGRKNGKKPKK